MQEHHSDSDLNPGEDHLLATQEIYALRRSLRRTNLFLKIIIGLLVLTIFTVLSMNIPDTLKKLIKTATCAPDRLLKSPVPPLALETRVFQKSSLYSQRPNKHSDTAWDGLLPVGIAFELTVIADVSSRGEDLCISQIGKPTIYQPGRIPLMG
jgi:hypothetical protein